MKIQKNDQVLIMSGRDKGRKGKVLRVFPSQDKILVEGIKIHKKHIKPKREGEKGQLVEVASPLPVGKVKLICPKCGKPTKIGYKIITQSDGKKTKSRICKKCGAEI